MRRARPHWTDALPGVLYGGFLAWMFAYAAVRAVWPLYAGWAGGAAAVVGGVLVARRLRRG